MSIVRELFLYHSYWNHMKKFLGTLILLLGTGGAFAQPGNDSSPSADPARVASAPHHAQKRQAKAAGARVVGHGAASKTHKHHGKRRGHAAKKVEKKY